MIKLIFALVLFLIFSVSYSQEERLTAFPGAEGFGAWATGGRGGIVYEVTNLNDDGPGSLRKGLEMAVPRTIVFKVSGTIALKSSIQIEHGDLTVAGQTAPGDGICVRNFGTYISAGNVIVRFMRFRLGDEGKHYGDALSGGGDNTTNKHMVIDHCSISWGTDEAGSFYNNDSSTVQWCIVSESLYDSFQENTQGYGGIWGGKEVSFHHNLYVHHHSRTPRFASSRFPRTPEEDLVDFRNNVIYNWGENNVYGGERRRHNVVANYYKPGPATRTDQVRYRILNPYRPLGKFYVDRNFVAGHENASADNWTYGVQGITDDEKKQIRQPGPFRFATISETSAEEAYLSVLKGAGATSPRRDAIDERIINEVKSGTASFGRSFRGGGKGLIDSQEDVGGWPELKTYNIPADSDHDGMPDQWEKSHRLDAGNPNDRNNHSDNGYTNLERYLNEIAATVNIK